MKYTTDGVKEFTEATPAPLSAPLSKRSHTTAYSVVDLEKKLNPSIKKDVRLSHSTDIRTIITVLIEKHVTAWNCLPTEFKDLMISAPEKFSFILIDNAPPKIIYNGVVLAFWNNSWQLDYIEV